MTASIKINRAFPFMVNFPFRNYFEMEIVNPPVMAMTFDEDWASSKRSSPLLINFVNSTKPSKMVISMHSEELTWLAEVAESVNDLDRIAKEIERGLTSKDVFEKRDAVMEAEAWLAKVRDHEASLSQETFNEVIHGLLAGKSIADAAAVINSVSKLYMKKGVISLSKESLDIVFTYFHFKLVYAKLILGIVIASKISL